jgi:SAM-dependent methyltransferase
VTATLVTPGEDADVETSSERYALRFAGEVGRFFLDVQARVTLDVLRPFLPARVLDVGGGHAQSVGPLVEAGHEVTVLGSAEACGARLLPWTDSGRARFRQGDLLAAPFADRSFDVVLAYRLLPHVACWGALVAELARLARRAVVVDYPAARSVNALAGVFFGAKQGVEKDTRPFRVFRDAELEAAFAGAGLRRAARRPQFAFPMALHRAHGRAGLARALEGAAAALGLTRALGSPVIARFDRER